MTHKKILITMATADTCLLEFTMDAIILNQNKKTKTKGVGIIIKLIEQTKDFRLDILVFFKNQN